MFTGVGRFLYLRCEFSLMHELGWAQLSGAGPPSPNPVFLPQVSQEVDSH